MKYHKMKNSELRKARKAEQKKKQIVIRLRVSLLSKLKKGNASRILKKIREYDLRKVRYFLKIFKNSKSSINGVPCF